jgi:hypothetical protein
MSHSGHGDSEQRPGGHPRSFGAVRLGGVPHDHAPTMPPGGLNPECDIVNLLTFGTRRL